MLSGILKELTEAEDLLSGVCLRHLYPVMEVVIIPKRGIFISIVIDENGETVLVFGLLRVNEVLVVSSLLFEQEREEMIEIGKAID